MANFNANYPYIFISYSHRDTEQVVAIINHLRENGFNIWYDEGIDPGTEWAENIAQHVEECTYFIAFVTESYINSKNCKDELNFSRDLDKPQLLVYLEDVKLPSGMAMRMNRIQSIFWHRYNGDMNAAFSKLYSASGISATKVFEVVAPVASEASTTVPNAAAAPDPAPSPAPAATTPVTPAPVATAPAPAKNKMPLIIGSIVAAFVLLLCVGGFIFWKVQSETSYSSKKESTKKEKTKEDDDDSFDLSKLKGSKEIGPLDQIAFNNTSKLGKMAVSKECSVYMDEQILYCQDNENLDSFVLYDDYGFSINIVDNQVIFLNSSNQACICNTDGSDLRLIEGLEDWRLVRIWANKNGCFFRTGSKDEKYSETLGYMSFSKPGEVKIISSMYGYNLLTDSKYIYFASGQDGNIYRADLANLDAPLEQVFYFNEGYYVKDMAMDGDNLYILIANADDKSYIECSRFNPYTQKLDSVTHTFTPTCSAAYINVANDQYYLSLNGLEGQGGSIYLGITSDLFNPNTTSNLTCLEEMPDCYLNGAALIDTYLNYFYCEYSDTNYKSHTFWHDLNN